MDYYNDEELLYLIHCGSEPALFLLLEIYYKKIRKWLLPFYKYQYQGVEFDDLVQVAMELLARSLDNYREDSQASLCTFLKVVVLRRVKSYVSSPKHKWTEKMRGQVSLDAYVKDGKDSCRYDEIIGDTCYTFQPASQLMIKEIEAEYLTGFETKASDIEKQVLEYLRTGYDQKEIADLMNISLKSVYNAAYRAYQKLQPLTIKNKCDKL